MDTCSKREHVDKYIATAVPSAPLKCPEMGHGPDALIPMKWGRVPEDGVCGEPCGVRDRGR